jgi:hypothetical protein
MSGADFTARGLALGGMARLESTEVGLGGQLVGYRAIDPETVGRRVSERLNDVICVKDFGAVGDGVADDTDAISNALRALFIRSPQFFNFRTGTGRLYFPEAFTASPATACFPITRNGSARISCCKAPDRAIRSSGSILRP